MRCLSGLGTANNDLIFKRLSEADRNGDGAVTRREAKSAWKKLPWAARDAGQVSRFQLKHAFRALDADHDRRLSSSELAVLIAAQEAAGADPAEPGAETPAAPAPAAPAPAAPATVGEAAAEKPMTFAEIATYLASQPPEPSAPDAGALETATATATPAPQTAAPQAAPASAVDALPQFTFDHEYKSDKVGAIMPWGMTGQPQTADKPYNVAYQDGVLRLEARQGDRRQKPTEIDHPIERTEISFPSASDTLVAGQTYKISFGVMFQGDPSTAKADKFFQVHGRNDTGERPLSPLLALQLKYDKMQVVVRHDENRITNQPQVDWIYKDSQPIERDRWYQFDITMKIDPSGEGMVKVMRDGEEIASYEGPVGYNDEKGAYAKIGIYRDTRPETQVRLYNNFSIAKADG